MGSYLPHQGLNPHPFALEGKVLTTREVLKNSIFKISFYWSMPESSSSSQGFNLKGWAVSARETEAASHFTWTACLFQAYDSLLYFYKSIRSEVWYFQFPLSQIYYLHKSLLLFKQSFCFSDSLGISLIIYYLPPLMCPIVNLWLHCNSCYIPQFTTYLPKSCLPLTSWAHYLLKRLLAIVSLKIPNFYKL